jgi:hypothetical protein
MSKRLHEIVNRCSRVPLLWVDDKYFSYHLEVDALSAVELNDMLIYCQMSGWDNKARMILAKMKERGIHITSRTSFENKNPLVSILVEKANSRIRLN